MMNILIIMLHSSSFFHKITIPMFFGEREGLFNLCKRELLISLKAERGGESTSWTKMHRQSDDTRGETHVCKMGGVGELVLSFPPQATEVTGLYCLYMFTEPVGQTHLRPRPCGPCCTLTHVARLCATRPLCQGCALGIIHSILRTRSVVGDAINGTSLGASSTGGRTSSPFPNLPSVNTEAASLKEPRSQHWQQENPRD